MKREDINRRLALAAGIAVASILSPPVTAQREPSALLEEIVVTARQRAERLQDVPDAITAFSGPEIERLGMSGFR